MVHPLAVYVLEQYNALQLTHDGRAKGLLLSVINLMCLIRQNVGQLVSGQIVALLGREGAVLRTEEYADERTACLFNHLGRNQVMLADGGMNRMGDGLVDHLDDVVLNVLALEHLQTLCVDGLTLGVQHIVILKDVLTNAEVAGFDLLLGIFDRAG